MFMCLRERETEKTGWNVARLFSILPLISIIPCIVPVQEKTRHVWTCAVACGLFIWCSACCCTIYETAPLTCTTVQKFAVRFFPGEREKLLLFSKDALNWSKVTVKTIIMLQKMRITNKRMLVFEFSIHQRILEENHSFHKNISSKHSCFQHWQCFLSSKSTY